MTEYAQIGASVCASLLNERGEETLASAAGEESVRFFEYRLDRWKKRIETRCFELEGQDAQTVENNAFLRNIFLLRANHLRIIVSRSLLFTGQRTVAAETVDVAAESINLLSLLYRSTKTYRFHQAQLDAFLISAVGIMLLALTQDNKAALSAYCNERCVPIPPQSQDIAQQSIVAVLSLLQSKARDSQHAKRMLDFVQDLLKRLNILDGLLSIPYPMPTYASIDGHGDPVAAASSSRSGMNQGILEVNEPAASALDGASDGSWDNNEFSFPFGEYLNFDAMLNSDPFSWII
jgi:hypothetical protein